MIQPLVRRLALLVENDPSERDAAATALTGAAFDVIACESPVAAELIVARVGADLHVLVTDLSLGDPDAMALAEFAAERCPHLRIITILGKEETHLPAKAHHLRKPYRADDLVSLAAA